jgi:hypothetical protein
MSDKVKIEIVVDMESGDYDLKFFNISNPGQGIDYFKLLSIVSKVLKDVNSQVAN